ncbi:MULTISPECIES: L,D-transpeptidase family protein [unclassified Pseudonocardia]|uniref:L,D-transpeptidase n=1 Tax=unclassified Pseudonocardia TaxID=2619320 RepID=UPI0001FFF3C7|nr:L,D-transpeptidase family protein [Pseudonocardia sp. Ae707_Ps1]OLM19006.1 putative secreted protein [Pseudonocardia sp. Ae707_Ps1]
MGDRERRRRRAAVVTGLVLVTGVGLGGTAVATADPEQSRVAAAAHAEPAAPGTPCSASVRACVDLETRQAWLVSGGTVERGPFRVTTGEAGKETPVGHSFRVYRKEADHRSGEYPGPDGRPARMPYSVFFADGGVAFHGGDLSRESAGCVKLQRADAKRFFDTLQIGDKVQVVRGSVENGHRAKARGRA